MEPKDRFSKPGHRCGKDRYRTIAARRLTTSRSTASSMSSDLWRNSFCRFIAGPSFLPAVNHDPDIHLSPEPTEMTECRSYRADADRAGPFERHVRAAAIPHRFPSWAANDIRKECRVL